MHLNEDRWIQSTFVLHFVPDSHSASSIETSSHRVNLTFFYYGIPLARTTFAKKIWLRSQQWIFDQIIDNLFWKCFFFFFAKYRVNSRTWRNIASFRFIVAQCWLILTCVWFNFCSKLTIVLYADLVRNKQKTRQFYSLCIHLITDHQWGIVHSTI